MKRAASIAVIVVLIGAVLAVFGYIWASVGDVTMSAAGWAALIVGAIFTVLLGCGLMALVFFSSRSGQDDSVAGVRRSPRDSDKR